MAHCVYNTVLLGEGPDTNSTPFQSFLNNGPLVAGGRGNEAYAFADFLLGSVQTAAVDFGFPELARRAYNLGVFANDDW